MTNNSTAPVTRDSLFASPLGDIAGFSFNAEVAAVFPDMLERSIPGYHAIIAQTGLLGARYAQADTQCYDLGCSLGATSLALRAGLPRSCRIIAIDNSVAMLERFQNLLDEQPVTSGCTIELRCRDISECTFENASVVAINFTLQFLQPEKRQPLLRRIYAGMLPGAALILSEKVVFADPDINQLHIQMHHTFKRSNGYSALEISQKRTALEAVMIPDTLATHQHRLAEVGFRRSSVWFQCFNFLSLIALK